MVCTPETVLERPTIGMNYILFLSYSPFLLYYSDSQTDGEIGKKEEDEEVGR